jgi:Organic solute transporter Ostalpha
MNVELLLMLLTLGVSSRNIFYHLVYFSRPDLQAHIIRIILLIPVSSVCAYLEVVSPDYSFVYISIADFWEALTVYSFFMMILGYSGGEHIWLQYTQLKHPDGLPQPWPFSYCYPPMTLDVHFLRLCKKGVLQFVLIKPLMVLINLLAIQLGIYDSSIFSLFSNIIYNLTYSISLYALAMIYVTMHDHPGLVTKNPIAKFFSVKTVIFFTFYQRYVLDFFPRGHLTLEELNHMVILTEMFIFSLPINFLAFSWQEFRTPAWPSKGLVKHLLKNLFKVLSPADVALTASLNFTERYQTHVLLEEPDEDFLPETVSTVIKQPENSNGIKNSDNSNVIGKLSSTNNMKI